MSCCEWLTSFGRECIHRHASRSRGGTSNVMGDDTDHLVQCVSRRDVLRVLALGAGSALIAACTAAPAAPAVGTQPTPLANAVAQPTTAAAAQPTTVGTDQPKPGGTLKVGRSDDLV